MEEKEIRTSETVIHAYILTSLIGPYFFAFVDNGSYIFSAESAYPDYNLWKRILSTLKFTK